MNSNDPKPPTKVLCAGKARASVWQDETVENGETLAQWSIKIDKTYRDRESGEERTTNYFYPSELADLALLARMTQDYVRSQSSEVPAQQTR